MLDRKDWRPLQYERMFLQSQSSSGYVLLIPTYTHRKPPLFCYIMIYYTQSDQKKVYSHHSEIKKERIRLGSLSRKLKRFNDKYTFFDADFVFYIPWPKSYFDKIISKRINYFEWYSLLFLYPKFYPNVHIIQYVPNFEM